MAKTLALFNAKLLIISIDNVDDLMSFLENFNFESPARNHDGSKRTVMTSITEFKLNVTKLGSWAEVDISYGPALGAWPSDITRKVESFIEENDMKLKMIYLGGNRIEQ